MRISRDRMADWDAVSNGDKLDDIVPNRDYAPLEKAGLATLRIWIPEPAKLALDRVVERSQLAQYDYEVNCICAMATKKGNSLDQCETVTLVRSGSWMR